MKILFLDIDGVCNSARTAQRHRGAIGIDPYMAFLVGKIVIATGCYIVLSSSWRLHKEGRDEITKQVCKFIDSTPFMPKQGGAEACERGHEIKTWLDRNMIIKCDICRDPCPGHTVDRYAILDDNSDMLPEQQDNFFKTSWDIGLTPEIMQRVIDHLNYDGSPNKT